MGTIYFFVSLIFLTPQGQQESLKQPEGTLTLLAFLKNTDIGVEKLARPIIQSLASDV
jgi:hypothetical protein